MLNLAYILQLIVYGLDNCSLSEHEFVMDVHERILHVLLDFRDKMYVVNKKHLEEILANVTSVGKELPEELFREMRVLQWRSVIHIAWRELPLHDFPHVIDYQVQLEAVEPPHGALSFGRQSLHGLVHVHPLNMARYQRSGVDDGNARALAQGAGLKEQHEVKSHLRLTLHEAVVGDGAGEFLLHVLADISEVEGFQVAETLCVKQDKYCHHLAVGKEARTVAATFSWHVKLMFFQFRRKIFAEFVENTENFY